MKIQSVFGEYELTFVQDFSFIQELAQAENVFVVIDGKVKALYREPLSALMDSGNVYTVEAAEENKTVFEALAVIDELVKLKSKRNTKLVVIGGGITQDICCFVSSVLYRGIDWYFIPTTLLAQTDSCIGSKSSINYHHYKNLIGTFYPPAKIWVNMQFVDTLEEKEYFSGLGEIFKCAIMAGQDSFYESAGHMDALLARDYDVLAQETRKALSFKKGVIEIDEFDKDFRNIMNYGHTFGHALESTSDFFIPHGQGVSCGILIANEVSLARGLMTESYRDDIRRALMRIISVERLKPEYVQPDRLLGFMRKDKKYRGNMHTCILCDESGVKKFGDVRDEEVTAALESFQEMLGL